MPLSNKQRSMNKTFTVLTNKHCSSYNDVEQDQSKCFSENINRLSTTSDNKRFLTFTKYKIKQSSTNANINQDQPQKHRYFDSPTMSVLDDEDQNDIPVVRCSNKKLMIPKSEPSLDETELSDLLIFTNPNRILTESMHVVISRHPSLEDLKYINDISSVLNEPTSFKQDKVEPIYHELIRIDNIMSTPPIDHMNDVDENKENRPPLMPIKCQVSRIPIWTPSPNIKHGVPLGMTHKSKVNGEIKKRPTSSKPCIADLLDEWSDMTPKLKDLLSKTRKIPLRIPDLTKNSIEFRRLKQLLNEMEVMTSSWTNAINQCRYVLQQAQQQICRL